MHAHHAAQPPPIPPAADQQHLLLASPPPSICWTCGHSHRLSPVWLDRRQPDEAAVASAAFARVLHNSPSLTAITLPGTAVPLPDLLAAGTATGIATGIAARLLKLTGAVLSGLEQLQALQRCTSLTHLDIRGSRAIVSGGTAGQGWEHMAQALQGMRNLTHLNAESCGLGQQGAEALCSALQELPQMQHLHVGANALAAAGLEALTPAISAMSGLQTLDVNANDLDGDEAAQALCTLLHNTPGLTHLDVSGNHIGAACASLLASALGGMTGLQELQVGAARLGDEGVAALAPALAALPRLHMLGLCENELTPGVLEVLQPVAAKRGSHLRSLELSCNDLGAAGGQTLALALRSSAFPLQLLHRLDLSYTEIGDQGWAQLAPAFSGLGPSLRSLDVSGLTLGPEGEVSLAQALLPLTGLTCLMCTRTFSAAGIPEAASALMGMRRLAELDLTHTPLGAVGTAALARALPSLAASLRHLCLSSCKLDADTAAYVLAPALALARGLVKLRLEHNELGHRAAIWLPSVLSAMPNLQVLGLTGCGLGAGGCIAVARCLDGRGRCRLLIGRNGIAACSPEHQQLRTLEGVKAWQGASWLLAYSVTQP